MATKAVNNKLILKVMNLVLFGLLHIAFYVVIITTAMHLTGSAYYTAYHVFGKSSVAGTPGLEVRFTVREGDSISDLAQRLEDNKLIADKASFMIRAKLMVNSDRPIIKGIYVLNTSMSYREIIEMITTPEEEQEEIQVSK
ncbi:endolytic transglycosylase MltG [Anaeromicropila populeti]|uniref:YceG-like family protein n=1 Tax=Anaeromicropila populeti TaxID=37658 RepID=A0A1I6IPC4_9FIRM|nr:endolytic transglycosylase MltG [Anaeromicropila populeti]SFR68583.1 YceG-like family protein [Anaeromicropila populeti]